MNTSKFDCEYTDFDPASDFYGRRVGAIKNPDGSVTKTPIERTEPGMHTFQFTLVGYRPETDTTDHLIEWVNAPSREAPDSVARFLKWDVQEVEHLANAREPEEVDHVAVPFADRERIHG